MDTLETHTQRRFRDLRISPIGSHNSSTSTLTEGLAAAQLDRRASSSPKVSDHGYTPPISVPAPATAVSRFDVNAAGTFESAGRLHDIKRTPSPQKEERQNRNRSISFAHNVQLDNGSQIPLHQPLPKKIQDPHTPDHDMPFQKYSLYDRPSYEPSPWTSGRFEASPVSADSPAMESLLSVGHSIPQVIASRQTYRDEHPGRQGNVLPAPDGVASLTSDSTASPVSDEAHTPPTSANIDVYMPASANNEGFMPPILERRRQGARSFQEGDPSSWPWSLNTSSRSKSFSNTKQRSLRGRKASCPSPNSPASSFLRAWSHSKAPEPDDEGQSIANSGYIIGKKIGEGGYSEVKEARTLENGVEVCRAVKIVKKKVKDAETENEAIQAEFEHEVKLWRHLDHRYILGLISVYDTNFATFCITTYNIGGTLFDLVKANRSGIEPRLAQKYAYQLASALRYLHQDMRIVHRDVKLENVLLNKSHGGDGEILLCDFGMAEYISNMHSHDSDDDDYDGRQTRPPPKVHGPADSSSKLTDEPEAAAAPVGSLQYAAPELIESTVPILEPCVDLWAYGVVLFVLHCGHLPFHHSMPAILGSLIVEAKWDQELLKAKATPEYESSLDVARGCLEKSTLARWDIARVLDSSYLMSLAEQSP